MLVPVTSDLAGYADFWGRMVIYIAIGILVLLSPVYVLLYMIWRKGW